MWCLNVFRDSLRGEKCLSSPVTLLTVLWVFVCPHAQCLHRCMDNSECPDKNRLPGDVSPAGVHCSGPRIGQESHSSTSYHALHSLFPKAFATSSLNLTCLWPLSCSETRRDALVFFPQSTLPNRALVQADFFGWSVFLAEVCWVNDDGAASWYSRVVLCDAVVLPPLAPLYTIANMIQLSVERISKQSVCFLHNLPCWIPGTAKSSFQLHNQCVHTCGGEGPMCLLKKGLELKSVLCVLWDECVTEDTIAEWGDGGLLGAGRASMAAKDLHYDGNRRFTVFLSERTAGRILTELKQKSLCGSGDARLAAASPLWNCPHSKSHLI